MGRAETERVERALLPHLDAAYNLARWLIGNEHDAEDAVQEAYLRAVRFFGSFRGGDGRGWLLAIVRHACYDWLRQHRAEHPTTPFEEELHSPDDGAWNPERLLLQGADAALVRAALEALPVDSREVLVLRELEGLSYKEIAEIAGIPVGTVMSRLSRARSRLQQELTARLAKGAERDVH